MAVIYLCLYIFIGIFAISALSGVAAFFIDIIRYPHLRKKIEVTSSAELAHQKDEPEEDIEEGLILDENIEIDL